MDKKRAVTMEEWEELIRQEKGLFYVSTDIELLVKNNKIGFKIEVADKIFDQAMSGFSGMLKDPKLTEAEKDSILLSMYHLRITPLRYH